MHADKNRLAVRQREPVTSGSVNVYRTRFEFSPDWDGMERVAVFKASGESRSVLLGESGECDVPWEVMGKSGVFLTAGVYGTRGGEKVLPTVWVGLGTILEGVTTGPNAQSRTLDLWEQELDRKGDTLGYTEGGDLGLYARDKLLSAVQIESGSEKSETTDHRELSHRDAEGQHPIESITGLKEVLSKTMTVGDTLSVEEILKIMEA